MTQERATSNHRVPADKVIADVETRQKTIDLIFMLTSTGSVKPTLMCP